MCNKRVGKEEGMRLMKYRLFFLGIIAASLAAAGCQSVETPPDGVPLDYLSARLYDFMDVFELNAGADITLDNAFAVVALEPLAIGGGLYDSEKIGIQGRQVGRWREQRTEMNFLVDCLVQYDKTPRRGNRYLFDSLYAPQANTLRESNLPFREWGMSHRLFDSENQTLDISAEVYLLVLGIDVGISPVELLDFVGGIFTFDGISNDDWENPRGWGTSAVVTINQGPEPSQVAIIVPESIYSPDSEFNKNYSMMADPASDGVEIAAAERPTMIITMESVPAVAMDEPAQPVALTEAPVSPSGEPVVVAKPVDASQELITLAMETREVGNDGPAAETAVEETVAPVPVVVDKDDPDSILAAYEQRFQQTSFRDPDQLYELALWCREYNLPRKATRHLRQTIALNSNHEGARHLLGYVRFRGKWVLDKTRRD